jgi:hypothetical protein
LVRAADNGLDLVEAIGGKYDEVCIRSPKVQVRHLSIPNIAFAHLMDDYNLPPVPACSIRYSCGVQDELINQVGLSVLSEMMCPTAAGRMLVETSSLLLAARLAHAHSEMDSSDPRYNRDIGWMTNGCGGFSHTSRSISLKTSPSPTSPMSRVSVPSISPAHSPRPPSCVIDRSKSRRPIP